VCTRNATFKEGIYVPGCPPHPLHIDDFLEDRGFDEEKALS
jgi:coenzyme F420-reducing hydrogenase gamma subunit